MRLKLKKYLLAAASGLLLMPLQGCFTGVESTKQIKLSKEDVRLSDISVEDRLLLPLRPEPAGEWKRGKRFYVTDDKAALNFDAKGLPADPLDLHLGGKEISFVDTEKTVGADGRESLGMIFDYNGTQLKIRFNSSDNSREPTSTELPMLVDRDLVDRAGKILSGREMWTRTRLRYDLQDSPAEGLKFEKVRIDSVGPGNMIFPLKVYFTDSSGRAAYVLMNYGSKGTESRSFGSQFALADPRKAHPDTDDEVWDLIRRGDIRTGMTKEECRLSLGRPESSDEQPGWGRMYEVWQYPGSVWLYFEDGILSRYRK